ncbi:MAG: hypothetical protein QXO47_10150 [Thermoproteota archaeon]
MTLPLWAITVCTILARLWADVEEASRVKTKCTGRDSPGSIVNG